MGTGFLTKAECQQATGSDCAMFGVDCGPGRRVALGGAVDNCFCDRYRPDTEDPCVVYAQRSDTTGIAMTVAKGRADAQGASSTVRARVNEREAAEASERLEATLRDIPGAVASRGDAIA